MNWKKCGVMEKGTLLKSASLLILIIFLFAGCSGKPSQSTIEELYVKEVKKHSGFIGQITDIKNFSVTNGLMKDNATYIADVSCDIVFKMNYDDAVKLMAKDIPAFVPPSDPMMRAAMAGLHQPTPLEKAERELRMIVGRQFKAGDKFSRHDKVTLLKKDKGWSLE